MKQLHGHRMRMPDVSNLNNQLHLNLQQINNHSTSLRSNDHLESMSHLNNQPHY
jgi:hypothetical protein